jgi:hypothetical protein
MSISLVVALMTLGLPGLNGPLGSGLAVGLALGVGVGTGEPDPTVTDPCTDWSYVVTVNKHVPAVSGVTAYD